MLAIPEQHTYTSAAKPCGVYSTFLIIMIAIKNVANFGTLSLLFVDWFTVYKSHVRNVCTYRYLLIIGNNHSLKLVSYGKLHHVHALFTLAVTPTGLVRHDKKRQVGATENRKFTGV